PKGCNRTALITLKTAVVVPMPSASAITAIAVTEGDFASIRRPKRRSWNNVSGLMTAHPSVAIHNNIPLKCSQRLYSISVTMKQYDSHAGDPLFPRGQGLGGDLVAGTERLHLQDAGRHAALDRHVSVEQLRACLPGRGRQSQPPRTRADSTGRAECRHLRLHTQSPRPHRSGDDR